MKKTLVLLVLVVSYTGLLAQPNDPFSPEPDNAVPITGLEWLLAGGAALGLKKIIGARKGVKKE